MKLLFITNGINGSGGLERVLSIRTNELIERYQYQIAILVLNDAHYKPFYLFNNSIIFISIKINRKLFHYFLQYYHGVQNTIREFKPDIISVCDDGLKGLLFPIIFGKTIPIIYERHVSKQVLHYRNNNLIITFILNNLMNWSAKKFDAFVILTPGNQSEWKKVKTIIIPNPLPFKSINSQGENNRAISVGKQSQQKAYDRLISIWEIVKLHNPEFQVDVYGKLNPKLGLEKLVSEKGLKSLVNFYPPVKNIVEKYTQADFYVLTSQFEGFGMVLIEAMACGLPCISFDVPHGPADIITDSVDGFLIPDGDIQTFAEKVIFLIENPEIRRKMGLKAKENVNRFLPDRIIPLWHQLYQNLKINEK